MRTGTLPLAVLRAGQGGWLGEGDGDPDSFKSRSRGQSPRGSSRDLGSPLAPVLTCARRWAQWCGAPALLWGDGGRNPRSAPSRLPCGAPSRWCPMGGAKPRSSLCWFSEPRGPGFPLAQTRGPSGSPFLCHQPCPGGWSTRDYQVILPACSCPGVPPCMPLCPHEEGSMGAAQGESRGVLAQIHPPRPLCVLPRGLVEDARGGGVLRVTPLSAAADRLPLGVSCVRRVGESSWACFCPRCLLPKGCGAVARMWVPGCRASSSVGAGCQGSGFMSCGPLPESSPPP